MRRSLESEQRTQLLDEKLRNFYALESRLKHSKSSSPISSSHPLCSREQLEQDLSKLSSP